MEIQYPSWTPDDLCEYHKIILGHIDNKKSKMKRTKGFEILESIIFNEEMKKVWPIIKRHSKSGYLKNKGYTEIPDCEDQSQIKYDTYGFKLLIIARNAYAYSLIKYKSRNQKKAFYKKVKDLTSELSDFLKNTEFDISPQFYHPDLETTTDNFGMLHEDHEAGYKLSNILLNLSQDAEYSEISVDNETQVLPYPNIKNAQRTAFIRVLSIQFMRDYNGYLYRTQATLSRCVLNDSGIDENTVKDALRNWSGGGGLSKIPEFNIIG